MMYLTFRVLKWPPHMYYDMPEGEKTVTRAFMAQYQEELEQELKGLSDG